MLKFIGVLCILAGAVGYGRDYNRNLRASYRRLILWKEYLLKMESEMVYLRKPLPELLLALSMSAEMPFSDFFKAVYEKLIRYECDSPAAIWRETAADRTKEFGWSKEEELLFWDCGRVLEQGEDGMLTKEAELLGTQIEYHIKTAQKELKDRLKVSMYLCTTAGIFLILLLI